MTEITEYFTLSKHVTSCFSYISFFSHFYCQLTIQGPPDKKIQLVINNLDISDSNDHGESFLQVIDGILGVSGKNLGGNQCFILSIISFSTHFQNFKCTIKLWNKTFLPHPHPYWFKVSFLPYKLGISSTWGEKHNFTRVEIKPTRGEIDGRESPKWFFIPW